MKDQHNNSDHLAVQIETTIKKNPLDNPTREKRKTLNWKRLETQLEYQLKPSQNFKEVLKQVEKVDINGNINVGYEIETIIKQIHDMMQSIVEEMSNEESKS